MLNQVVVVGRLVENPIIEENENGKEVSVIKLAVPRSFKNEEGVYDTDFIECTLWNGVAKSTTEYCKKGDLIGIKGKLTRLSGNQLQVVAEKVTFLSSNHKEE